MIHLVIFVMAHSANKFEYYNEFSEKNEQVFCTSLHEIKGLSAHINATMPPQRHYNATA